uniref:Uncharacterized protein n=1 Tax=Moniliophthora roreri TaxID=221103 RepID=A0A0W0GF92_MONRR
MSPHRNLKLSRVFFPVIGGICTVVSALAASKSNSPAVTVLSVFSGFISIWVVISPFVRSLSLYRIVREVVRYGGSQIVTVRRPGTRTDTERGHQISTDYEPTFRPFRMRPRRKAVIPDPVTIGRTLNSIQHNESRPIRPLPTFQVDHTAELPQLTVPPVIAETRHSTMPAITSVETETRSGNSSDFGNPTDRSAQQEQTSLPLGMPPPIVISQYGGRPADPQLHQASMPSISSMYTYTPYMTAHSIQEHRHLHARDPGSGYAAVSQGFTEPIEGISVEGIPAEGSYPSLSASEYGRETDEENNNSSMYGSDLFSAPTAAHRYLHALHAPTLSVLPTISSLPSQENGMVDSGASRSSIPADRMACYSSVANLYVNLRIRKVQIVLVGNVSGQSLKCEYPTTGRRARTRVPPIVSGSLRTVQQLEGPFIPPYSGQRPETQLQEIPSHSGSSTPALSRSPSPGGRHSPVPRGLRDARHGSPMSASASVYGDIEELEMNNFQFPQSKTLGDRAGWPLSPLRNDQFSLPKREMGSVQ